MDPLKMYFLLNMGIFQPAMLGNTRGTSETNMAIASWKISMFKRVAFFSIVMLV